MILGMPARIIGAPPLVFTSPWIAGPIGTGTDKIVMRSPDGINWSTAPTVVTGITSTLVRIYSDSGLILASGPGGPGSTIRYSLDNGATWGNPVGLAVTSINGLCKSGSYWITSGNVGTTTGIYRSIDGVNWTLEFTGSNLFEAIFYNSAAIVGSNSGNSRRSTNDGDTWATASVAGLSSVDAFVKTSTHVIAGQLNGSVAFVRRSTTGLNGSYSSSIFSGSAVPVIGYAANLSGEVLLFTSTGATFVSTNHGSSWAAGATISGESQISYTTRNCAAYADGAWMVSTYDDTVGTARIWRATSPSGPWTEVATFTSNGGPLAGVRYFAP